VHATSAARAQASTVAPPGRPEELQAHGIPREGADGARDGAPGGVTLEHRGRGRGSGCGEQFGEVTFHGAEVSQVAEVRLVGLVARVIDGWVGGQGGEVGGWRDGVEEVCPASDFLAGRL